MLALAGSVVVRTAAPQVAAGTLANFKDQQTWTGVDPATGQPERGLGLVIAGRGGSTRLAFLARGRGTETIARVQVLRTPSANPAARPPIVIRFTLDPGTPTERVIDLSSRVTIFPPGPGVPPESASAPLSAADLESLVSAKAVDVRLLDVGGSLSPGQLDAIRAWASASRI
jgi:hypothetical protein